MLLDLDAGSPLPPFTDGGYLQGGRVSVMRGALPAAGEMLVETAQLTAMMHVGPAIRLDWRIPPAPMRSQRVRRGMVHVNAAGRTFWLRWGSPVEVVIVAVDAAFAVGVSAEMGVNCFDVETVIGVMDWNVCRLAGLCERELQEGGGNGALYLESLGTAMAAHIFRRYGRSRSAHSFARGGIAPARLRHVLDYVEENLSENLSLSDLATLAGTSLHHFAHAFKQSTGVAPHRFLIERRVARARLLLADPALPIAEIALILGFSDQSHFTEHFRHITGITPGRYRRDL